MITREDNNNNGCFTVLQSCKDSFARMGQLKTAHGIVSTPVFSPVGSQATVKTMTPEDLESIGIEMVLANTYHLYLRPGIDVIEKVGGIHDFMSWKRAILTDSGGYQIFSLARLCKVNDEGVTFRSHIDGSSHMITPRLAVEYQVRLGSDIIMVLDQCPPPTAELEEIRKATKRTHRWAGICRNCGIRNDRVMFAIVQGGLYPELRRWSAETLTSMDFAGYAIGGLSLGEPKNLTINMVRETVSALPVDKPRYLMGVGSPEDIMECVDQGIDIFDSALPTQVARKGALFTARGRRNIRNSIYKDMEAPFDPDCDCYTCSNFSAAYLNHLFKCRELLAYRLATIHNLSFISRLMRDIRLSIAEGTFPRFKRKFIEGYVTTDERVRVAQKKKWLEAQVKKKNGRG